MEYKPSGVHEDKQEEPFRHICAQRATFFPFKWPLLQFLGLWNKGPGRSPSASATHNIAESHRALLSPLLINHISSSRFCLFYEKGTNMQRSPVFCICNFDTFFVLRNCKMTANNEICQRERASATTRPEPVTWCWMCRNTRDGLTF